MHETFVVPFEVKVGVWYAFNNPESRTYIYTNEDKYTIHDVVALCVMPSGNHRLLCTDGALLIVASGWDILDIVNPNVI